MASTMAIISGRMMRVLTGQLEQDDHGGDRGPGGAGEDRTHADQGVGAGRAGEPGATWWTTCPKAAPSIAPMNRLGANTPPEPPMPMVRLVAIILPTSSDEQEPDRVVAGDAVAEDGVADAVHLRQHEQQATEQQPAGRRAAATPGPRQAQSQASSIQ